MENKKKKTEIPPIGNSKPGVTPEEKKKHQEDLVDESLAESFPASDPATPYRVITPSKKEDKDQDKAAKDKDNFNKSA